MKLKIILEQILKERDVTNDEMRSNWDNPIVIKEYEPYSREYSFWETHKKAWVHLIKTDRKGKEIEDLGKVYYKKPTGGGEYIDDEEYNGTRPDDQIIKHQGRKYLFSFFHAEIISSIYELSDD